MTKTQDVGEGKTSPRYRNAGIVLSAFSVVAFLAPWVAWALLALLLSGEKDSWLLGVAVLPILFVGSASALVVAGLVALAFLLVGRRKDGTWPSRNLWRPVVLGTFYPALMLVLWLFTTLA